MYEENVILSSTKSFTKNSSLGDYVISLPANESAKTDDLQFYLTSAWSVDTAHTAENNTYTIPIVKCDVELDSMKLVDENGNYADRSSLAVGAVMTPHYFYKNNTDCTVYVKGYNDDKSQIPGVYSIPAGETIEVAGKSFTVPNKRDFSIWGGVFLSTVERMNTDYETNEYNNVAIFLCKSNLPLFLMAVAPNAAYREDTDVISSFRLYNPSGYDYKPSDGIKVRLRVYKEGQSSPFLTLSKNVVVPALDYNLVYFKWHLPSGQNGHNVILKADIYDSGSYYRLIFNSRSTTPYTDYSTPDTRYEEKAPSGFSVPSEPSGTTASARWDVYEYEDGEYVQKTYAIAVRNDMTNEIAPATGSTAQMVSTGWKMKSGYGISLRSDSVMAAVSGYSVPQSSTSYTVPQYAYALLPEYGYVLGSGKAETLNKTRASDNTDCFTFKEKASYGNVHFTPLWYPNGKYIVKVVQSDCWTPAGMISINLVTNSIKIQGNAYDDWYTAGRR